MVNERFVLYVLQAFRPMLTEHAAQTGVFYCFCLNQTQSFASEPLSTIAFAVVFFYSSVSSFHCQLSITEVSVVDKNIKNPSADVFSSTSFRADAMALCLRANSRTSPTITTRCFATKDIIRGKNRKNRF